MYKMQRTGRCSVYGSIYFNFYPDHHYGAWLFFNKIFRSAKLFMGHSSRLIFFIIFSVEGGLCSQKCRHTVGGPDGGPGFAWF